MRQKAKKAQLPLSTMQILAALRVLERAAKRAKETARRSHTPLVVWQDGRVKTVRPGAKGAEAG